LVIQCVVVYSSEMVPVISHRTILRTTAWKSKS
jgi:hypothetical protein